MGEGWLYIPSIGFFALIAIYLSELMKRSKAWSFAVIFIACSMLLFYSFLTIERNNAWSDSIRLSEESLKYSPDNAKFIMNTGIDYKKKGNLKKAMEEYEKALKLDPNYPLIYNNIGNIYLETGKYDDAIKSYKKAIEIDPSVGTFYANLGKAYQNKMMHKEAVDSFEKALNLNPNNKDALEALKTLK
ncbi:MAG: tetratricopeptide repeat protein [Candidatus Omnitrophota bacterium]|mgnify:CR=1 FL=1